MNSGCVPQVRNGRRPHHEPPPSWSPTGWGLPCPPSERRGGASSVSALRVSVIRMCSSVQANDLPCGPLGIPTDQEGSHIRRAGPMSVLDLLRVCTPGDLRRVLGRKATGRGPKSFQQSPLTSESKRQMARACWFQPCRFVKSVAALFPTLR